MRYAALLVLLALVGCVRAEPKVDGSWRIPKPHPTREEILAMAKVEGFEKPKPLPMQLFTFPKVVMSYMDMRVVCVLPDGVDEGKYTFGVEGLFTHSGDITKREYSKYIKAPCTPFKAFCAYQAYVPPAGYQPIKQMTLDIEPAGECR